MNVPQHSLEAQNALKIQGDYGRLVLKVETIASEKKKSVDK